MNSNLHKGKKHRIARFKLILTLLLVLATLMLIVDYNDNSKISISETMAWKESFDGTIEEERQEVVKEVAERKRIEEEERIAEEKRLEEERLEKERLIAEKEQIEKERARERERVVAVNRSSEGRSGAYVGNFLMTAYDDTPQSQGKWVGKSATGSLVGKTLGDRIIAVDPNVIPLYSLVHIDFPAPYEYLSGQYQALDTGGAIKGSRLDLFSGGNNPSVKQFCRDFGRRNVELYIIRRGR